MRRGPCVELPSGSGYFVVEVRVMTPGGDRPGPVRVHLTEDGAGRYRVVGLERPRA